MKIDKDTDLAETLEQLIGEFVKRMLKINENIEGLRHTAASQDEYIRMSRDCIYKLGYDIEDLAFFDATIFVSSEFASRINGLDRLVFLIDLNCDRPDAKINLDSKSLESLTDIRRKALARIAMLKAAKDKQ